MFLTEEIKSEFLDYVGLAVSCFMFMYTVIIISITYEAMTENNPVIKMLGFSVMTPLVCIILICSSPEILRKQVWEVDVVLQRLQLTCTCETQDKQLAVLRGILHRLRDFNIGGCFSLGNHVLISVGGFVLTYLVVLLQVGETSTFSDEQRHYNNNNRTQDWLWFRFKDE
ncbi:putative 7tm Chemosensory receptor-containing protein 9 [Homarus americanus]|uniref:Putative 7tm Chemosensory receptor-containing protein 9 n=1 Tax=Homarus americanus TaxID=6706 RepID=A0A8J5KFH9_HOMAM|nr:putative 7tm Chemosensory receptor-containing protein 9 [Homarus americanus]